VSTKGLNKVRTIYGKYKNDIKWALLSSDFHGCVVISKHKTWANACAAEEKENRRHKQECVCGGYYIAIVKNKREED
jgi:hypothetical protein